MSRTARLDNVSHADLCLAPGFGAPFGDSVNQMPVFIPEFGEAQRDYPLLFLRPDNGDLQAVAILGLDRDENLFLADDRWDGAYVPALARRGPFLIGVTDGEPVIHVDLDHPRIRPAGHGEPLFLAHGGQAPALERAIEALRTIHLGHRMAREASSLFEELGLVVPVTLDIEVSDREVYSFKDYLAVTPERIAALDGEALARLNQAGLLMAAVNAASSLGNMARLIARKRARASLAA